MEQKNPEYHEQLEKLVKRLVKENSISVESLTEMQVVSAIKQAILAGDLVREILPSNSPSKHLQEVKYIPYYEKETLCAEIRRLKEFLLETKDYIADGFYPEWLELHRQRLGFGYND